MKPARRQRFDELFESVVDGLPDGIRGLLDEVAVMIEDTPTREILEDVGEDPDAIDAHEALCGLHTGIAFTEQSVEDSGVLPPTIMLFRVGIVAEAGGWEQPDAEERIREEIRITLLHEIGHQFGLDEDDLARLGYE